MANSYETFYKAEWILANLLSSRVDSRKCSSSRVDSRKCLSKVEWILANVYQKPGGFSQTFYQAEWILANAYQKPSGFSQMFIKSQVDSRKPLIKSRVDSRKPFIKPSGFSQTFYKAEWILANLLSSWVDSRKSCTKPSGFWRNVLQNPVDFRQTFMSQTDSLQIFFSYQKVSSLVCLV